MSKTSTFVSALNAAGLAALLATAAIADEPPTLENGLSVLIADTLQANLELAAADATLAARLAEIDEARARFKPALDLSSRYSQADGGRTIDLPIGDLLNPLYASLRELGGPTIAPIPNQRIEFLRSEEQDTRLSLTQAIHDPRIAPALAASRGLHRSASAASDALRARLIRDVRQGYYTWLAARDTLAILDSTLEVARENLRANRSLFENGKITRDLTLRAEADLLEVEQQRRAAETGVTLAASYVNVLRRAPLNAELPRATIDAESPRRFRDSLAQRLDVTELELQPLTALAIEQRSELVELDAALEASGAREDLARAALKPRVAFALDAGSQGNEYAVGDDERYVLASIVLQFSAYSGGGNQARVRASRAETEALAARRQQTELAIMLEVQRALENLTVAEASLATAARRVAAAEAAFAIVARKRDLGQINQTEFLDARNTLTDARLNLSRTRADALARLAELEYAIGLRGAEA